MPDHRLKITNASIQKQCPPPEADAVTASGAPIRQKLYFDTKLPGFGVVVTRNDRAGAPTRTFFIQRDVNGRTRRVKIGRFGDMYAEEARKAAHDYIAQMLKGIDPNAEKRRRRARGVTLKEAADDYRLKPAKRTRGEKSPLTLGNHDRFLKALSDWQARPLAEITRQDVLTRHRKLTGDIGPVGANNVLRWFRAVYNAAMIVHESLTPNPCIVLGDRWNREVRKRAPVPWDRLAEWGLWVDGELRTRNPVRADLFLFIIFTGLRSTDAATVKWHDVNLKDRKLHRPSPKGGADRAFDVPLSDFLVEVLDRRKADNPILYGKACPWVFPAFDRHGKVSHVSELKEGGQPSPHRLRDTFATAAHEAGIASLDIKILMNHALPQGDVTEDYMRPTLDHLRAQQERISKFLLDKFL